MKTGTPPPHTFETIKILRKGTIQSINTKDIETVCDTTCISL